MDAAAGGVSSYAFRANSCFDPNSSGVGHQPSGFDQWTVFYNHHVVVGSICKATFSMTGTTASGGLQICGINLADDSNHSADITTLLEQPLTKARKSYYSVDAGKPTTVRKGFSCKKFFNITNVLDNISRLGSSVVTNPTEEAIFILFTGNPNAGIDPPDLSVLVEIEYVVVFSEPKELAQS
uniref:hypothetical protein n=1 Tax=Flavobacterium sp. TaxID=239 RepID=UPI0040475A4C